MEECQFDVIIFGTGLVNSITASALSKAGYRIAHIDSNPYYGADEASLSLEELIQWADKAASGSDPTSRFQCVTRSAEVPSQSRQYSICLQPSVIPSVGPLISSLIASSVAKYSGFRLLDCISVYDSSGRVTNVPGSKQDIFKSKAISLIEKRRLMRFLTFALGDFEGAEELKGKEGSPFLEFLSTTFSLSHELSSIIAYSLAFSMSPSDTTLPALRRLQKYLRSGGRYGPSPFLIGHYGGIGDITQGFCRASAVSGGVYILSRKVNGITRAESSTESDDKPKFNYTVKLDEFPDTLSCRLIISPPSYVPANIQNEAQQLPPISTTEFESNIASIARCIAIIDQPLLKQSPDTDLSEISGAGTSPIPPDPSNNAIDTAILVFPPSSVIGGSVTHSVSVLVNGEASLATPKGKWLVYIMLPLGSQPEKSLSPESLLRPYLEALLNLAVDPSKAPIKPLFTTFYFEYPAPPLNNPRTEHSSNYLVPSAIPFATSLPDMPDYAAVIAESTFKEAIKVLQETDEQQGDIPFWPPLERDDDDDDDMEW